MKVIHQKSVLLLVILIGFAFIAVGLTIGYYMPLGGYETPAGAGLPPLP